MEYESLYRFSIPSTRIEGLFLATDSQIKDLIGKSIISSNFIQKITDNTYFIEKAKQYGVIPFGFNPIIKGNL